MKLSHLRIDKEYNIGESKYSRVVCDISTNFCEKRELFFYVKPEFEYYLTYDVYDAFMVSMLFPAMYYNEAIEIDGLVSKKLYHNIMHYVQGIIHDFAPERTSFINIKVKGFKDSEKNSLLHIGTGFSGGVDSFSTLKDNFFDTEDPDYKVDTLFFFHIGQYGKVDNPKTWERAENRFSITKKFAEEVGLNAIMLNTNLFDFLKPEWEYQVGVLCRISSILIFQKALKRYYISNAYTYGEMIDLAHDRVFLEEFSDPYIMPLLSPKGLEIVCDGAQYKRSTKTERITSIPLTRKFLNVCVNFDDSHLEAKNCSLCSKCMRTMMALESIGKLEDYKDVFDLNKYRKHHWNYKKRQLYLYNSDGFARDNIDFARLKDLKLPNASFSRLYFSLRKNCGKVLRTLLKPIRS